MYLNDKWITEWLLIVVQWQKMCIQKYCNIFLDKFND